MSNLKVLGTEITLTTANTVSNAKVVRLVNLDSANTVLVTLKDGATTVATFTLGTNGSDFGKELVIKEAAQTLEITGVATVKAAPIGYY